MWGPIIDVLQNQKVWAREVPHRLMVEKALRVEICQQLSGYKNESEEFLHSLISDKTWGSLLWPRNESSNYTIYIITKFHLRKKPSKVKIWQMGLFAWNSLNLPPLLTHSATLQHSKLWNRIWKHTQNFLLQHGNTRLYTSPAKRQLWSCILSSYTIWHTVQDGVIQPLSFPKI